MARADGAARPGKETRPKRRSLATDGGLVLIAVIWGLNFPVMKAAIGEASPLAVNALRFPLAALAVAFLLRIQRRRLVPKRRDWGKVAVLGAVGHVVFQIFFIYALDLTSTGNAALLLATAPVWTVLVAASLGRERLKPGVLAGALITLAGMAFLVAGGSGPLGGSRWGDLLMVVAAISWALYTVLGRRAIEQHGALEVTGWALWVGAPFLFLAGLPDLWRLGFESISLRVWLAALYSGVLAVGLAYTLWYRAVGRIGQGRTAVYQNLVPVVALLVAWAWLGEVPTGMQVAGTGVILTGLIVARREGGGGEGR